MAKKQVKNKEEKPTLFKKIIKWFWIVFAGGIASVFLLFLLASWGALGEMPSFEILENPQTNLASQVLSSDGKILGKYYLRDNRTPVDYKELPKDLVNALVATEDARFYDHSGIDVRGTIRAAVFLGSKGGASTISQQLAKQLFHGERAKGFSKYTQKIKEWVIATRLERQYTKEEIIAMYFIEKVCVLSLNSQNFNIFATFLTFVKNKKTNFKNFYMIKNFTLVLMGFLCLTMTFAQERECSTMENLEYRKQLDPQLEARMQQIEDYTRTRIQQGNSESISGNVITIPVVVHEGFFESGWDGWTDGGSDCFRYSGSRSYEGNYSIRLRDNSGTASAMTSETFDLRAYDQVEFKLYFYANSMESGEDFWIRYYNGSSCPVVSNS